VGHHPADEGIGVIWNMKGYFYGYGIGALVALIITLSLDLPLTLEGAAVRFLISLACLCIGGEIGERVIKW